MGHTTIIEIRMPAHSVMRWGGVFVEKAPNNHVWMRFQTEVHKHGQALFVDLSGPAGQVFLKALEQDVRLPGPVHPLDTSLLPR